MVDLSTRLNPVVSAVLRTPFHWLLSPGLMLITVTGRRSGCRYTIPVSYYELDDAIVILVAEAHSKKWWRNYRRPGSVELLVRGKTVHGVAETLAPESAEFKRCAEASFRRARFVHKIFGIDFDARAGLSDAQMRKLGDEAAIVKVVRASA